MTVVSVKPASASGVSVSTSGPRGKAGTVTIGSVVTLASGEAATVENVGTEEEAVLDFGLPAGDGDMNAVVYDPDGDGIVDEAASVPWTGVQNKPAAFPPADHNHDDRYFTETEADARFLGLSGGTMTGPIVFSEDQEIPSSDLASQAEAEAGTDNVKVMTSLRTAQAIVEQVPPVGLALIGPPVVASADAAIDILLSGDHVEYLIKFWGVRPSVDQRSLLLRTSSDDGATFDSGTSDYMDAYISVLSPGTAANSGGGPASANLQISFNVGADTNENGMFGEIRVYRPHAPEHTYFSYGSRFAYVDGSIIFIQGSGRRSSTTDVDAVRLFFSGGANIASGTFQLYAMRTGA